MSGGQACQCAVKDYSAMRVLDRYQNHSAFNGYHATPPDYSTVTCYLCENVWRTKASYVALVPDTTTPEADRQAIMHPHRVALRRLYVGLKAGAGGAGSLPGACSCENTVYHRVVCREQAHEGLILPVAEDDAQSTVHCFRCTAVWRQGGAKVDRLEDAHKREIRTGVIPITRVGTYAWGGRVDKHVLLPNGGLVPTLDSTFVQWWFDIVEGDIARKGAKLRCYVVESADAETLTDIKSSAKAKRTHEPLRFFSVSLCTGRDLTEGIGDHRRTTTEAHLTGWVRTSAERDLVWFHLTPEEGGDGWIRVTGPDKVAFLEACVRAAVGG